MLFKRTAGDSRQCHGREFNVVASLWCTAVHTPYPVAPTPKPLFFRPGPPATHDDPDVSQDRGAPRWRCGAARPPPPPPLPFGIVATATPPPPSPLPFPHVPARRADCPPTPAWWPSGPGAGPAQDTPGGGGGVAVAAAVSLPLSALLSAVCTGPGRLGWPFGLCSGPRSLPLPLPPRSVCIFFRHPPHLQRPYIFALGESQFELGGCYLSPNASSSSGACRSFVSRQRGWSQVGDPSLNVTE